MPDHDPCAPRLVQHWMSQPVHSVGPQANLDEVSELMRRHRIRHVPVVSADATVLGLISHRDLLGRAFGGGQELPRSIRQPYLRSIPVAEVMTRGVVTAAPDEPLRHAAHTMWSRRLGCLPVVDGERLVGILTASDFVRLLAVEP